MASTINASTTLGLVNSADTSGVLQLQTANTTAVTIDASQNVGVGTASPSTKLDVVGQYIRVQQAGAMAGYAIKDTTANKSAFFQYTQGSSLFIGAEGNTPIIFANTDSLTTRATIDSSGNLGLGVTPSAWYSPSAWRAMQIGNAGIFAGLTNSDVRYTTNSYLDSAATYRYINNGYATFYNQANGAHNWNTAASGTAGNAISFTQAMTLTAGGDLGIGTTSPLGRLHIETTSGSAAFFVNSPSATDVGSYISLRKAGSAKFLVGVESTLGGTSDNGLLYVYGANALTMYTNGSERARINSSGLFLINATSQIINESSLAVNSTGNTVTLKSTTAGDGSGIQPLLLWNSGTSGNNIFQSFFTETSYTLRGSISYNRAGGLTTYNTTSDYRAKDISGPVINSGALIDSVPVYMGKMKGATQERPMFIAHETPEYAHTGEKDAVDADGNPVYQQMDASSLIPVMWAEIQSLRQRLAVLEGK